MKLQHILGQERALKRLTALHDAGRIPPALLFAGPEGVGKSAAARAFAKKLNCSCKGADPCASCESADKGIDPDLHFVDAAYQAGLLGEDAAKQRAIKIETVRHLIRDMEMRSVQGRWKTAILDDAHGLVPAAANAMLKSLEEPPPKALWILVTHRPNQLLGTIRSRCQTIPFVPLSEKPLIRLLRDRGVPEESAVRAAAIAEGSLRRAEILLENSAPEPAAWLKDPLGPCRLADELPKELHLARDAAGEHLHRMAWHIRRTRGREGFSSAAVRTVQRELADMRRALAANADPRLVVELAAIRLQQLDALDAPA